MNQRDPFVFTATNFVEHFRQLVAQPGLRSTLTVRDADGERRFDYATLERRARAIGATLQARYCSGERILLMLENDEHYVAAFLGCLYAGLVAVPVFPPESVREQHLQRLIGIAADACACCVMVSEKMRLALDAIPHDYFGAADILAADTIDDSSADAWREHAPRADDIAFLQYTSGSTSAPKGVMVSHGNLMANEVAIRQSMAIRSDDVFVSWLPLYHDMGLIGGLLQPLSRGLSLVLMSPRYFLERPARWLQAIADHRATVSGGPDFSYRLCLERVRPGQLEAMDLSCWRLAFSGAEPVRHDTLSDFAAKFSAVGFDARALYPCYGLAEATLLVSGSQRGYGMQAQRFDSAAIARAQATPADEGADAALLVSCGVVPDAHAVRIVEATGTSEVDAGSIGEILVAGPSVAHGYWQRPEESAVSFIEHDGQRWLRTGDLGFFSDGHLYIAGRSKDLIIVRGQNLYPQDIERTIESAVEAVRKGRVSAFAIQGAHSEGIGIAVEVSRSMQKRVPPQALVAAINEAVAQNCMESPGVVILLNPGALPKTSSGKLQRSACRNGWQQKTLDAYALWEFGSFVLGATAAAFAGNESDMPQAFDLGDDIESRLAAIWQAALKRPVVSADADFFRQGGNSLAAMQVVADIVEQWNIDFRAALLFTHPQLRDCAVVIRGLLSSGAAHDGIVAVAAEQRPVQIPLSHSQRGLWLNWQLQPDSPAYNLPGVLDLRGPLQMAALSAALRDIVARHEALRTVFPSSDGQPHQQVLTADEAGFLLPFTDLRQLSANVRAAAAELAIKRFASGAFRLDAEMPLRAMLLQRDDAHFQLVLCIHHIAADGWSLGILLDELAQRYQAHAVGEGGQQPPLAIQFADYALWQQRRMHAGAPEFERQLRYWQQQLAAAPAAITLPFDRPRNAAGDAPEGRHVFSLPRELSDGLRALAAQQGTSLYTAMLGVFALLLERLGGAGDLCIGAPLADRQRRETRDLIAYLVNVQVLRVRLDGRENFSQLLAQLRRVVHEAQDHQDLPFDVLVHAVQAERIAGAHPLFQVKCTQQESLPPQRRIGDLDAQLRLLSNGQSHFDLSLDFTDRDDGIDILLAYSSALFEVATVAGFATLYQELAQQVVAAPQRALGDVAHHIIDPAIAQGAASVFAAGDVIRLWRDAASVQPDAVALQEEQRSYSHSRLLHAVEALARRLRTSGVGPEVRVAVHAGRNCEFVLGMLAVLRAGGVYVPLDPQLPADRLAYQLQDSAAALVLHAGADVPAWLQADSERRGFALIALDMDAGALVNHEIAFTAPHPLQAAYVIYTSGSTGQPKGVTLSHGALANYVQGVLARLALPSEARSMAMVSTVAADLGHTTLFGALCSGRSLHLISAERAFDPDRFADYLRTHRIDVLKIVPSHLQALLHAEDAAAILPRHTLVLGGEATSWSLLARIHALQPQCRILNHYGPTETTVGILTQEAASASRQAAVLGIGAPLPNGSAYVLDRDLRATPTGVAGELYLGGAGVARGYLDRAALTADRFVPHPFADGERLYRSGDLVRRLRDGSLEFLGRIDDQVKIRGYRVELNEIRSSLLGLSGIVDAAVIAVDGPDGRAQLAAYVVAGSAQVDPAAWRAQLAQALPDYMLPSLTVLPSLPLTANGKLDRGALPRPQLIAAAPASQGAPVVDDSAPQGEQEQALAAIWAEVLKQPTVGRHDNFFELGGDSILTLKIVARARKVGVPISPKQLMEKQTIAAIVGATGNIKPGNGAAATTVAPSASASTPEKFSLSPVQRWFCEQGFATPHHWNQSVLLDTPALDAKALQQALSHVARHHHALQLRFRQEGEGGVWQQWYADAAQELPLEVVDLSVQLQHADQAAAIAAAADAAHAGLQLERGPLLRALWLKLDTAGRHGRLLLVAHHLIVDGVSWRILLDDLQSTYARLRSGLQPEAPLTGSSFRSWTQALGQYALSRSLLQELDYWKDVVAQPEAPLAAFAPARNTVARAAQTGFTLSADDTARLLKLGDGRQRVPVQEALLSALADTLCATSARDNILIELEGHGREDIFDGIDAGRTVGWFTSLYPVRLPVHAGKPAATLQAVREQLQAVPHKGIGYGVLRYLNEAGKVLAQGAYPQVTFNYLGHFDHRFEPAGWQLATEKSGAARAPDSRRRSLFEIVAHVQDGRLQLQWTYCRDAHDAAHMAQLLEQYRSGLLHLIAHFSGGKDTAAGHSPIHQPMRRRLLAGDFPLAGLTQQQLDAIELPVAAVDDIYPLSPMQSGMLFHSLLDPDGGAYINQLRLDIGRLDVARFHAAWQEAVVRHTILRTGFLHRLATPLQWVAASPVLHFDIVDLRAQPAGLAAELEQLAQQQRALGFDLEQAGLMRLLLVDTGNGGHHLIWTRHHLLLDGWSSAQLLGEILRSYAGEILPPQEGAYRDYIGWLHECDQQLARDFWRAQLKAVDEPTLLAGAVPLPSVSDSSAHYADVSSTLDAAGLQALQQFARSQRITVSTLLQGAWAILLQRYCGRTQALFGVTSAGRPTELAGVEQMLGLFINTLPLVVTTPDGRRDIGDWLRELQQQALAVRDVDYAPLYDIQRWAGKGGQALFDSILVVENYPMDAGLREAGAYGLDLSGLRVHEQTSYPMTVVATIQDELSLRFGYSRKHFSPAGVAALAHQFRHVLRALSSDAQARPQQIGLCDAAAQRQIRQWSENPAQFAYDMPVHRLFERHADTTPDAIALVAGTQRLSYAELNRRANRLAHRLIAVGVKPDSVVGVLAERSVEMVVALLAIEKAGGAYLPLDPDYPADRLAYMLEDSRPQLLLTHQHLHLRLSLPRTLSVLQLDPDAQDDAGSRTELQHGNPDIALHGDHLAYVIYTSGSTGKPKGAGNRHRSLHNRLHWMQQAYALSSADVVLQKTPFGFDVSVWEFFWPLMTGAQLVMAPPGAHRDPQQLAQLIQQYGVTTLHFVPSMLHAFVGAQDAADCTSLRRVVCSGEALPAELQDKVMALLPQAGLFNLYGPTEAAIDITHWTCISNSGNSVPIGRPISASQTYVLDADLNPVPPGVAGELYLGGVNLARGYLGRAALTAERFVASPFAGDASLGERLYRTGDLVRWRADGQIDYLGRLDHQVKIRGLRIELGEIEAQLLAQPEVSEAVVVARDLGQGGGPVLIGYVAAHHWQTQTPESLKAALSKTLPDYMVPTVLVPLSSLPLNANGKIDRKALPAPDLARHDDYVAAQGETETRLAQIWSELLGVERIGRFDHFFELGGHSLLASGLIARLRYQWSAAAGPSSQIVLPLRFVFEHPRLHELAACIDAQIAIAAQRDDVARAAAPEVALEAVQRSAEMPLSPAQQRLWLVDRMAADEAGSAYNMSAALSLEGDFSLPLLQHSLDLLIARHEILRTGYGQNDDGDPCAIIADAMPVEIVLSDFSLLAETDRAAALRQLRREHAGRRFTLARPPLLRVAMARLEARSHVLLFAIHHIVADGWSVAVMVNELVSAYRSLQQAQAHRLPPLAVQYADYAVWQQRRWQAPRLGKEEQFWRDTLAGVSGAPVLPADLARPASVSHAGRRLSITVPPSLRSRVEDFAATQGVTPYLVLLTAFLWLLHQRSGADDLVVGTDVAGRPHPDLEALVGFFVNVLPLRSRLKGLTAQAGFIELLRHSGRSVLEAFEHQELPFERIVEAADIPRDRRWNPLVQILFVLQNTPQERFTLPGLDIATLEPLETRSKFDLALFVSADGNAQADRSAWRADWVYASAVLRSETVQDLAGAWLHLLEQVLAAPQAPLPIIPHHERPDMNSSSSTFAAATTTAAAPAGNKLDKLKSLKGRTAAASATAGSTPPRAQVRTSFLEAGRSFPLVIEPTVSGLDMAGWAQQNGSYIADMLNRHGGILFRNFGLQTPQDFETFAEAIEPELYGNYGDLPKKEGGKNTYRSTPYPEKEMILFHNESAHLERWPRKQWFFCELPSPVGGATPIVDCREVYRRLPAALIERMEERQLRYVRTFTDRLDVNWRDFFKTDDRNEVEARLAAAGIDFRWLPGDELQTRTLCPAVIRHPQTGERVFFNQVQLHHVFCLDPDVRRDLLAMVGAERMPRQVMYGDGSPIDDDSMALIGRVYEECAVRFQWRQGDVVMLDNMIAAHARDPFEGPRKIVVAMGAMFDRKDLLPLDSIQKTT